MSADEFRSVARSSSPHLPQPIAKPVLLDVSRASPSASPSSPSQSQPLSPDFAGALAPLAAECNRNPIFNVISNVKHMVFSPHHHHHAHPAVPSEEGISDCPAAAFRGRRGWRGDGFRGGFVGRNARRVAQPGEIQTATVDDTAVGVEDPTPTTAPAVAGACGASTARHPWCDAGHGFLHNLRHKRGSMPTPAATLGQIFGAHSTAPSELHSVAGGSTGVAMSNLHRSQSADQHYLGFARHHPSPPTPTMPLPDSVFDASHPSRKRSGDHWQYHPTLHVPVAVRSESASTASPGASPLPSPDTLAPDHAKTAPPTVNLNLVSPTGSGISSPVAVPPVPTLSPSSLAFLSLSVSSWSSEDVWTWLHYIKLPSYPQFYHRRIDGDMMLDMTDDDLSTEMQVTDKFHRGKIRKRLQQHKELLEEQEREKRRSQRHQQQHHGHGSSRSPHHHNNSHNPSHGHSHHSDSSYTASPHSQLASRMIVNAYQHSQLPVGEHQHQSQPAVPVAQSTHSSTNSAAVEDDRYDYYVMNYEVMSALKDEADWAHWEQNSNAHTPTINTEKKMPLEPIDDEESRDHSELSYDDTNSSPSDDDEHTKHRRKARQKRRRGRTARVMRSSDEHRHHHHANDHPDDHHPAVTVDASAVSAAFAALPMSSRSPNQFSHPPEPSRRSAGEGLTRQHGHAHSASLYPTATVRTSHSDLSSHLSSSSHSHSHGHAHSHHSHHSHSTSQPAPSRIERLASVLTTKPNFIDEVTDLTILNEGIGGRAYKGYYHSMPVVVKLPKSLEISGQEWREWQAHLRLPAHPNLVTFIGALVVEDTNYLVTKLIRQGSLKIVLHRDQTRELYSAPFAIMRAAREIANGLKHLHQYKIVHRDISSRNILVDADGSFVIADLGLCREMVNKQHAAASHADSVSQSQDDSALAYEMGRPTALPARWTSPESLRTSYYTSQSDVWSLGVTLWEMTARGGLPYADIKENVRVIAAVAANDAQLAIDQHWHAQSEAAFGDAADRVRRIIAKCLERDSDARLTSTQLSQYVESEIADWSESFPAIAARLVGEWNEFHESLAQVMEAEEEEQSLTSANGVNPAVHAGDSIYVDQASEHVVVEHRSEELAR